MMRDFLSEAIKNTGVSASAFNQGNSRNYMDMIALTQAPEVRQPVVVPDMSAMYAPQTDQQVTAVPTTPAYEDPSSPFSMKSYLNKIANIESGGKYDALNSGSGAYGKFQFIPSTENAYAKRLGFSRDQARTPQGQEAMMSALTQDNINSLKRAGIPITYETLYAAHQQGAGGATNMYGGNGKVKTSNLASNLPKGMAPTIANWKKYWGGKLS